MSGSPSWEDPIVSGYKSAPVVSMIWALLHWANHPSRVRLIQSTKSSLGMDRGLNSMLKGIKELVKEEEGMPWGYNYTIKNNNHYLLIDAANILPN